jgi:hypothetical protein
MRRTFVSFCAAILLTALASAPASAATLRLELSGLNVVFDGHSLTDATDPLAGQLDPAEADPLATVYFSLDGVVIGSLTSNIWADLAIFGIDPIPASGNAPFGAFGGTFDLLTGPGQGISLDLFDIELFLFGNGALFAVAKADLLAQILVPFDVALDPSEEILVVLSLGPITNQTSAGGFLTGFEAFGSTSIIGDGQLVPELTSMIQASGIESITGEGTIVPEPTSMLLLGTGLLAAVAARRRAQR